MTSLPFSTADVEAAPGPLLVVHRKPDGSAGSATCAVPIRASRARVWSVVSDVDAYASRIPMMDKIEREGDKATVRLKFKVAIVSVRFAFTVNVKEDKERSLELDYISGEPANIRIHFQLEPGSKEGTTVLYATIGFDIDSLGWLVKYFLKNHPEIKYGVFTGSAFALVDKMREASESA